MALRDPGAPRRNPLFAVDDDGGPDVPFAAAPAPSPGADDGAGPGPADGPDAGDDGWDDWADDPVFGRARDPLAGAPGNAVGPLLAALGEAGPEAAEHLVNAAHELTLAVKVVVDAFERTLSEQRAVFAAEHSGPVPPASGADPTTGGGTAAPRGDGPGAPRVQNIDIE